MVYRRRRFWHATLRLRSAICRHHPRQRAVLSHICCFGEHKVDGAEPRDADRPGCLPDQTMKTTMVYVHT